MKYITGTKDDIDKKVKTNYISGTSASDEMIDRLTDLSPYTQGDTMIRWKLSGFLCVVKAVGLTP